MADDETRMLFIAHALTGSAHGSSDEPKTVAARAIEIADAVLDLLRPGERTAGEAVTASKDNPTPDPFLEVRRTAAEALVRAVAEAARQAGYGVIEQPAGQFRIRPLGQDSFEAHIGVHDDGRPFAGAGPTQAQVPHQVNRVTGIRFDPAAGIFMPEAVDPQKPRDAFAIVAEHVANLIKGPSKAS